MQWTQSNNAKAHFSILGDSVVTTITVLNKKMMLRSKQVGQGKFVLILRAGEIDEVLFDTFVA
jgi:hypothetical protein